VSVQYFVKGFPDMQTFSLPGMPQILNQDANFWLSRALFQTLIYVLPTVIPVISQDRRHGNQDSAHFGKFKLSQRIPEYISLFLVSPATMKKPACGKDCNKPVKLSID
jgi:hypothetical protein